NDDQRRSVAQKLLDPAINLRVGTHHLAALLALFANDVPLALAAYNAGEAVVVRYDNQVPPYPETQEYVKLVQQFYAMFRPPPAPTVSALPAAEAERFDRAFSRATGAALTECNAVHLLLDARENFPAWLDAIRNAQRYVLFESYIIADDRVGREFVEALAAK